MENEQSNRFDYDLSGGAETTGLLDTDEEDTDAGSDTENKTEEAAEKKKSPKDLVKEYAAKYVKASSTEKAEDGADTETKDDVEDDSDTSSPGENDSAEDGKGKDSGKPEPKQIPMDLIVRAAKVGLESADIEKMDAASLTATLSVLEKQVAAKPGKEAKETAEDNADQEDGEDSGFEPLKLELDPEVWEGELVDTLNKINAHYDGAIKKLVNKLDTALAKVDELQQERQAERNDSFVRWFDNEVVKLGEDYKELFGAGTMDELPADAAEAKNRVLLANEMATIKRAHPDMPKEKVFTTALKVAFSEHEDKLAAKRAKSKAADLKNRTSQRPTHRTRGDYVDAHSFAVEESRKSRDPRRSAVAALRQKFGNLFKG